MPGRTRVLVAVFLTTGLALLAAAPASAALCAHWETPSPAVVGRQIDIGFRTYVPEATSGGGYTLRPHDFPDYPFKVSVQPPTGGARHVSVAPSAGDSTLWRGEFTPDVGGTWTLHIENLQAAEPRCYEDVAVLVESGSRSAVQVVTLFVVAIVLAGLASGTLMRRRRPSRAARSNTPTVNS